MNNRLVSTASFINRHIPDLKNKIIHEADMALAGMLILPGSGRKPVFVGNLPKWKDNPTPQKDREAIFVLNRMEHWKPLLQAFMLTGDERYAARVTAELSDWISACERPDIPEWTAAKEDRERGMADLRYRFDAGEQNTAPWRSLEAGFRMFQSWYLITECLEGTPLLTKELWRKLCHSVQEHAEVLTRVTPLLYPEADHNHYLMEMAGLFFAACKFPDISKAEQWKRQAVRGLERSMFVQYTEGGGQIEGCPHYHNECLVLLMRVLLETKKSHIEGCFGPAFQKGIYDALTYALHTCRPTGVCVPWGDSDASTAPVKSALYGAFVFEDKVFLETMEKLAGHEAVNEVFESCIWDCPDPEQYESMIKSGNAGMAFASSNSRIPLAAWYHPLSQVCLRSSWRRDAVSLFAACRLPVQNPHAHMDPGGIDLTAYGRTMVADPGRFTYNEIPERKLFKSAFSHTTLTINGKEPFEYISSWHYGEQGKGRITEVSRVYTQTNTACRVMAEYAFNGFVHQRLLYTGFFEPQPFLAVFDRVTGLKKEDYAELHFHVNYTRSRAEERGICFWEPSEPSLLVVGDCGLEPSLRDGWISETMDRKSRSLILDFREREAGTAQNENGIMGETRYYGVVLVPLKNGERAVVKKLSAGQSGLSMELNGRTYHIDFEKGHEQ